MRQSSDQLIATGDQLFTDFLAKVSGDGINSVDASVKFPKSFRYVLFEPVEFGPDQLLTGPPPPHYSALFAVRRQLTPSGPIGCRTGAGRRKMWRFRGRRPPVVTP
jgi:hypothetical protein